MLIGGAVLIGSWRWARRTGRYVPRWRSVAAPLLRRERREARRQVQGQAPVVAARLPVLLGMAREHRRVVEGALALNTGIRLVAVGNLVGISERGTVWALLLLGPVYLCVIPGGVLQYRRAGDFLRRHGPQAR